MKFLILLSLLSSLSFASERLSGFETDYCTNYPEGTKAEPELWKHCCLMHDMFFWAGGDKSDRLESDLELRTCIEETGARTQAKIMYAAVRAGSLSPVKYPKMRWNNGWDGRGNFQKLSADDVGLVERELFSGYDYISLEQKQKFINFLQSRLD